METSLKNYNRLKNNLDSLGLEAFLQNLDQYLEWIETETMNPVEALCRMTEAELKRKEERAYQGCVKAAGFPFLKTLEDYDFNFQPSLNKGEIMGLKTLRFTEKAENIILVGSPGVGKTHIAVSLGIEAAKNRKSTYFINCHDLLLQLKKAQLENRLEQRLKFFAKYKVLIIDEVGFLPMDSESSKLFFQLISKRYEKRSTIITTNKDLSKWGELFDDPLIANAILDRLIHHCHLIKIIGASYRMKDLVAEVEDPIR